MVDFELAVGLGFSGGYFADRLVEGKPEGDGQCGLLHDLLTQFGGETITAVETVHTAQVDVEFVDGGFFVQRYFFVDDLGDHIGIVAVAFIIAADDNGVGT